MAYDCVYLLAARWKHRTCILELMESGFLCQAGLSNKYILVGNS